MHFAGFISPDIEDLPDFIPAASTAIHISLIIPGD
jgi:hypothetical protein